MSGPAAQSRSLDRVAVAAMLLLCVSWGLQYVATKIALNDFPPLTQAGVRSVLATLIVGSVATARGERPWRRDGAETAGLAAGLLFSAMIIAIYVGLQWTTAARVILFVYTAPIFVALGSAVLLPDDRLRPMQWLGMALALAGVGVAVAGSAAPSGKSIIGDLLALAAAAIWAATTLLIRASALRSSPPIKVFLYQFGVSAIVLNLAAAAFGERLPGRLEIATLVSFAYQTLWIACVTYLVWFALIARYKVGELSAFTFLTPVIGVGAGHIILGDPLSPRFMGGAGFVIAGIVFVNLPGRFRSAARAK
jgi:drug/metabolite transporter (DMT)-like permease